MITALLLGIVAGTTFEGGRLSALAEHLWEQSRSPVAIVTPVRVDVPKFSYEDGADSRARAIKASAKLIQPPGLTLAFYHEDFLRNLVPNKPVGSNVSPDFERSLKNRPVVEGGKATIQVQGNEGLFCSDLRPLPWSKPLDTHWTMDRSAVLVFCAMVPETDALAAIARAYAGRLVVKPKAYSMVLDGAEFRRRALNLYQRFANDEYFAKRNPAEKAAFSLTQLALRAATPKDIEIAFATPESEAGIVLDYGTKEQVYNLLVLASRDMRGFELAQINPREQTANLKAPAGSGSGVAENFARRVDWNGPVTIYLSASFGVRLEGSSRPTQQAPAQKLNFSFPAFIQGQAK